MRVDNGPGYIREKLKKWASSHGVTIQHIQPGQPQQNAYIHCPADDALHRREGSATTAPSDTNGWTNTSCESIEEAQDHATQWLWIYNDDHPNIPVMVCRQTIAGQWGIGGITPAMKLKMAA